MTSPVIQSIQYTGTTLYIIFDRAVTGTGGNELDGFTFTITPGPTVITPTFSSFDQNAIVCTLAAPVGVGETLTSDYVSGSGTIVDAATGLDAATSFSSHAAVAYYSTPLIRRAQVASGGAANDTVTIFFGEPVGSPTDDLLLGLTIEVDNVALDLTSATATLNDDQTELTVDTGSDFAYNVVVDVIYASGTGDLYTWASGAVADFTLNAIDNLSTDGLPNSDYPLSTVIALPIEIVGNVVTAKIEVYLNPVDIALSTRYGPAQVATGGDYGTAPNEVTILGSFQNITDGAVITDDFSGSSDIQYLAAAANDYLTEIVTKIGIELGKLRADDQNVTIGANVISQV